MHALGNPTFNIFGWQKPCYLIQDGYVKTFKELIETTDWDSYGRASGNHNCQQCMVHCGYEPSAVDHTFRSPMGLLATIKSILFSAYPSAKAKQRLEEEAKKPHGPLSQIVQLGIEVNGKKLTAEDFEAEKQTA